MSKLKNECGNEFTGWVAICFQNRRWIVFYVHNDELCVQNDELCVQNDELRVQNDECLHSKRWVLTQTSRGMEGMFNDMRISVDTNADFKEYSANSREGEVSRNPDCFGSKRGILYHK